MLGISWYGHPPKGIYELKYFKFYAGAYGMAANGVFIRVRFIARDLPLFVANLESMASQYPFARYSLTKGFHFNEIDIAGWNLYDYDFAFAEKVEELLDKGRCLIVYRDVPISPLSTIHKSYPQPVSSVAHIAGDDKIMLSGGGYPDKHNAIMEHIDIPMVNADTERTESLIKELKSLMISCKFRHSMLSAQRHKGKDFFVLMATNGRQGANLEPLHFSDYHTLKVGLDKLFTAYNLISRIKTNSYDEHMAENPTEPGKATTTHLTGDLTTIWD